MSEAEREGERKRERIGKRGNRERSTCVCKKGGRERERETYAKFN